MTAVEWVAVALAVLGVGEAVRNSWNTTPAGVPLPGGSFPMATPDTTQPPAGEGEGLQDLSGA